MILRVPDYYSEFSCIADQCRDSCCIGWEIDVDEDTYTYYRNLKGSLGDKLRTCMYETEDNEHSFQLQEHGRCPFLNGNNLCDICLQLGEEALSEVCTEYPRFTLEYGNVRQKCLSLSCEEVGRILFEREPPVRIVEYEQGQEPEEESVMEPDNSKQQETVKYISWLEEIQNRAVSILQNRKVPIRQRMQEFLIFMKCSQEQMNGVMEEDADSKPELAALDGEINSITAMERKIEKLNQKLSYVDFNERFHAFEQMEVLDDEWEKIRLGLRQTFQKEHYEQILREFMESSCYQEADYEQLMIYFLFRYFMNAVYDYHLLSYAKLAVVFSLVIRDMDALRYWNNGKKYGLWDRIDNVRIFSKEVEHYEENVELIREAARVDAVFSVDRLLRQI